MIEIKDLTFGYEPYEDEEKVEVLKNINLNIKKGEFVVILGHNGSGKSTLAKLINAQYLPDRGSIFVEGIPTTDESQLWDIKRKCGMVFQNPDNQLVATIVEEDVAFGPENLAIPMPELKERVDRALALVEMEDYRGHSPALLSGGQKQRIAIAGILAMNPDCILLDEPTAMLDPVGRQDIMRTIDRLNREQKKTIVHITHYMEEAVMADRILVINEGVIAMEGSPREIFSQVGKMKELGLDVPQVTELAYLLRQDGFDVPTDVLTVEELCDAL
ncbi:MAG: energy-coupling factor transporter ATPase [Tissierellia bacterium]|nr:energy-coupling factor transporter ATPase [Tissierellia bacterium]